MCHGHFPIGSLLDGREPLNRLVSEILSIRVTDKQTHTRTQTRQLTTRVAYSFQRVNQYMRQNVYTLHKLLSVLLYT